MQLYRNKSSHPLVNAQRNLMGRTHYVDPDTLCFHRSRVISARHTDQGLLFAIVTSDSLDYEHTRRGFRFVIFDLFGTVLVRTNLEDAFHTSKQAEKEMWSVLNDIDAKAITLKAMERAQKQYLEEMRELMLKISQLEMVAA